MLQTAPPGTIEQAHTEAFATLTPDQRRQVLAGLADAAPANERADLAATPVDDPRALARIATRAEVRHPGTMERTLGGGAMRFGANLLSSFAVGFVGSMVANRFFSALAGSGEEPAYTDEHHDAGEDEESGDADEGDDTDFDDGGDFEA